MKKNFKVILDCDDVLFECNSVAIQKLNAKKGTRYTLYDIKSWGETGTEIDERLEFYSDENFFKELPVIQGAKEFVRKLSKKAEIFICTNVPLQVASIRANAIKENFPEIKPENILIGGRKDLLKADMMLDDCIHNLVNANVSYPVLMQRPWNYQGNAGILSVDGYDQFLELVDTIKYDEDDCETYEAVTLVGPSGAGKGEIIKMLETTGKYKLAKVYTTRKTEKFTEIDSVEFIKRKENGFFSETSTYMGAFYGICNSDVDEILREGLIPVFSLDINGAMSVRKAYKTLNVFVNNSKENCIRSVLQKGLPLEETTARIAAIDSELKNEELCSMTITRNQIEDILQVFSQGRGE